MSVIVFGSANIDAVMRVAHLPRPGETVAGRDLVYLPGGKGANQAIAAARFGVPTRLLGAVGCDDHGETMRAYLIGAGVDVAGLATLPGPTGLAQICVEDAGENQIVVIAGANGGVTAPAAGSVAAGDVALVQMELPPQVVERFLADAAQSGALTILNTAPALIEARGIMPHADIVVLNETELAFYLGHDLPDDTGAIARAAKGLICRAGQRIVVTLGAAGVVATDADGHVVSVAAPRVAVVDTVGAGDCFCGVLAAALAQGQAFDAALRLGVAAAAIAVQRVGAGSSMPLRAEIPDFGALA